MNQQPKTNGHLPTGTTNPTIRCGSGTIHGLSVWAALSDRGLCCLHFADGGRHNAKPEDRLQRRSAGTHFVAADAEVKTVLAQIEDWLDGRRPGIDVKLDLRGTPFQERVWQALQEIPRGQTWSYTELAQRVGRPKAVRAVAMACARNPVAILVPCHRIVRKDGGLGGYAGGLPHKRELLAREQANG
jgi:AraC family transcriptional regulator, regulatory protein of adaptative response / methylated-DNA-[protein]-cysteine methyltransferase